MIKEWNNNESDFGYIPLWSPCKPWEKASCPHPDILLKKRKEMIIILLENRRWENGFRRRLQLTVNSIIEWSDNYSIDGLNVGTIEKIFITVYQSQGMSCVWVQIQSYSVI